MSRPLKVLMVEDSEEDAILITRELKKGDFNPDIMRVQTAKATKKALENEKWDVVLSDYKMPGFNGLEALKILKKSRLDIPFILVSGTIGESLAVEAMKAGCCDYVMKDNLERLTAAIDRELRDEKIRNEKRLAEESLRQSEKRYRTLFECLPDGIVITDAEFNYTDGNLSICRMLGYTHDELIGLNAAKTVVPQDAKNIRPALLNEINHASSFNKEWWFIKKDGSTFLAEVNITTMPNGDPLWVIHDITDRTLAEEAMKNQLEELQRWQGVMLDREDRVQQLKREVNELCNLLGKPIRYTSQKTDLSTASYKGQKP